MCLNPALIQSSTSSKTVLRRKPTEQDYCFLAVACKDIQPGSELFLNYGTMLSKKGHFWAPDQYFDSTLCPKAVSIDFSEDSLTASITASDNSEHQDKLKCLRDFIDKKLTEWKASKLIYALNKNHQNPFSGGQSWTPGDVRYLFERLNIPNMNKFHYLSYLYHCIDNDGRLDNSGVNYFYAFIENDVDVAPPVNSPVYIEDVIEWLKQAINSCHNPESEETLKVLKNELQLLEMQEYRKMDEGEEKKQCLQKERKRVLDYIQQFKVDSCLKRAPGQNYIFKMSSFFLSPSELWPDLFRDVSVWSTAHIRCLALLEDPTAKVDPLDRVDCFRFDTPEYTQALHEALQRKQKEGETLESIRTSIGTDGLFASIHRFRNNAEKNYRIPLVEGIPDELQGSSRWLDLTIDHWRLLGFEETGSPPLRMNIERLSSFKNGFRKATEAICGCNAKLRDLWINDPCIKDGIKKDRSATRFLLKHLINKSGAKVSVTDESQQWRPIDTLRVCKPDSDDYRAAMKTFLEEAIANGLNRYEIVAQLSSDISWSKIKQETIQNYSIGLPAALDGYERWTPLAVSGLLEHFNLSLPENSNREGEFKSLLERQLLVKEVVKPGPLLKQMTAFLERNPEISEDLISTLHINPERLKNLSSRTVRYIFVSLGINPDQTAVKDSPRNQKFDKIYAITNKHPEWSKEVMRLIEYYKIRESDQAVAEKLNQGTYAPVPLPPGCQAEKWTADILVDFIRTCKQTRKASVSKEPPEF